MSSGRVASARELAANAICSQIDDMIQACHTLENIVDWRKAVGQIRYARAGELFSLCLSLPRSLSSVSLSHIQMVGFPFALSFAALIGRSRW